jgi:hypothetical protein
LSRDKTHGLSNNDDGKHDGNDGPPDLLVIRQEVQLLELSEDEALQMPIAQSKLEELVKWDGLACRDRILACFSVMAGCRGMILVRPTRNRQRQPLALIDLSGGE